MKKIVLSLFAIGMLSAIVVSCQKEKEVITPIQKVKIGEVEFYSSQIHSQSEIEAGMDAFYNNRGPIQKIKKWIKAHTGTHLFNNCSGSNPCGPCPGICIPLGIISYPSPDGTLSEEEIAENIGALEMTNLDDATMVVSFPDARIFTINNTFYVTEDINMGEQSAGAFNASSFIIKKGVYPLSYRRGGAPQTIINIELR